MGYIFVNVFFQKKLNMLKNCTHITITSLLLWRIGSVKSAVFLCGVAGEDFEKGVFIDKAFFEPFYLTGFVVKMPKSKVIQLLNKN